MNFFDNLAHKLFMRGHLRAGTFMLGLANLSERKPWGGDGA